MSIIKINLSLNFISMMLSIIISIKKRICFAHDIHLEVFFSFHYFNKIGFIWISYIKNNEF